jgi:bacterioferritin (cytochrome b1)
MHKLAQTHPEKLLDLLTERLTFERAAVKLYDTVIAKMKVSNDPPILAMLTQMTKQRNDEKDHEEWLEEQVRALGSDAHTETELSELIERESRGIVDVIAHDDELPHLFHALVTAELVDDNGWKLLLELADDADDEVARRELRRRAHDEEKHLLYIRTVVAAFTRHDLLGRTVHLPTAP